VLVAASGPFLGPLPRTGVHFSMHRAPHEGRSCSYCVCRGGGDGTDVELTQEYDPDHDAATHATQNWQAKPSELKRHVEDRRPHAAVQEKP
jgi:hypothetical protein